MYNRYIPQSDGSYQRNRLPDKARSQPQRPPERRPQSQHTVTPQPPCFPSTPPPCRERREEPPTPPSPGIGRFLRNLLPKDFDTEDLLVILMFLLMSKDCKEEQNSALLTLALYLFM